MSQIDLYYRSSIALAYSLSASTAATPLFSSSSPLSVNRLIRSNNYSSYTRSSLSITSPSYSSLSLRSYSHSSLGRPLIFPSSSIISPSSLYPSSLSSSLSFSSSLIRSFSSSSSPSSSTPNKPPPPAFLKHPIQWFRAQDGHEWWVWLKKEARHYWEGSKLFGRHTVKATKLIHRRLQGNDLTRSERRFLQIHLGDWVKMGPFIVIAIVPFMELALPFLLKFFPNMLPSTYLHQSDEVEKRKQQLKIKLEALRFIQETTEQLTKELIGKVKPEQQVSLTEFNSLIAKVRSGEGKISSSDIIKYSALFNDEFTLENLPQSILIGICNFLGTKPTGSLWALQYKIKSKLRELKRDDVLIEKEGVDSLTHEELEEACRMRGIYHAKYSDEARSSIYMRAKLKEWLELSLQHDIPITFLILSRVLSRTMTRASIGRLEETEGSLSASVAKVLAELPNKVVEDAKLNVEKQEEIEKELDAAAAAEQQKKEQKELLLSSEKKPISETTAATIPISVSAPVDLRDAMDELESIKIANRNVDELLHGVEREARKSKDKQVRKEERVVDNLTDKIDEALNKLEKEMKEVELDSEQAEAEKEYEEKEKQKEKLLEENKKKNNDKTPEKSATEQKKE